jgi:hypothetical protein
VEVIRQMATETGGMSTFPNEICFLVQQAVAGGPRATDRFAAVTAAFVSGLAGTTRAAEVTAFFLEAAAARMEAAIKVRHNVMYGQCWRS